MKIFYFQQLIAQNKYIFYEQSDPSKKKYFHGPPQSNLVLLNTVNRLMLKAFKYASKMCISPSSVRDPLCFISGLGLIQCTSLLTLTFGFKSYGFKQKPELPITLVERSFVAQLPRPAPAVVSPLADKQLPHTRCKGSGG